MVSTHVHYTHYNKTVSETLAEIFISKLLRDRLKTTITT